MPTRIEYSYDTVSGVYSGPRENKLTYLEKDFYPLPFCILDMPKLHSGVVPVISSDKTKWEYKTNKEGTWFNIKTKQIVVLAKEDYDFDVSEYTTLPPLINEDFCLFKEGKWVINEAVKLQILKQKKSDEVKSLATSTVFAVYPMYKQQNLTNDSDDALMYLTGEIYKPASMIRKEMSDLLNQYSSIETIKFLRDVGIDKIDLEYLLLNIPTVANPTRVFESYRIVLKLLISLKLKGYIRDWCNIQLDKINQCSLETIENFVPDECPNII